MNPQIKQKWVDALRSGDYQQTKGRLRKEDKFCCLGVLCDLYGKENNVEWEPSTHIGNDYKFQDNVERLPVSVKEWADLEYRDPRVDDETNSLAELNDGGSTFNEIAYVIEKQL